MQRIHVIDDERPWQRVMVVDYQRDASGKPVRVGGGRCLTDPFAPEGVHAARIMYAGCMTGIDARAFLAEMAGAAPTRGYRQLSDENRRIVDDLIGALLRGQAARAGDQDDKLDRALGAMYDEIDGLGTCRVCKERPATVTAYFAKDRDLVPVCAECERTTRCGDDLPF